jgi:hypothetical protein
MAIGFQTGCKAALPGLWPIEQDLDNCVATRVSHTRCSRPKTMERLNMTEYQGPPPLTTDATPVGPPPPHKKPFYKRLWFWVIVVLAVAIIGIVATNGNKTPAASPSISSDANSSATPGPESEEAEPNEAAPTTINFQTDAGSIVYIKHEVTEDYEGNPALVVYFDYTNLDPDEAHSAAIAWRIEAFQNGVSQESTILGGSGLEGLGDEWTDIKEGATVQFTKVYSLQDTTSDVELEVSEFLSFSDDKQTQLLSLD